MFLSNGIRLGLAGSLILGAASVSAEELVRYDFVGGSPAATVSGSMTGTDVTLGPFLSPSSSPSIDALGVFVQASDTNTTSATTGISDLADALDSPDGTGDYIRFTIDSTSAMPFSISNIRYTYTSLNNSGFVLSSHLLTSATGFTASDSLNTVSFIADNGSTDENVDVSGISELQGLTGPVEIRLYFSDSTFNSAPDHRIDTIIIEGIPEPGSLALLGLGGVCLMWRRHRGSD